MTYLITGGSGFIGSHLVEQLLKNGHSVINIDNFDEFYDYKIKIKNTLESLGLKSEFHFNDKETDIQKLATETKSDHYLFYFQDIRDKNGLEEIFQNHKIDADDTLVAIGYKENLDKFNNYIRTGS